MLNALHEVCLDRGRNTKLNSANPRLSSYNITNPIVNSD
jgi:hypothetical protein